MRKYAPFFIGAAAFLLAFAQLSPSKKDDIVANLLYKAALAFNASL